MKNKRVAIVCDPLIKYGGAEKVLFDFLNIFPNCDIYTLFIVPYTYKKIINEYPGVKIHTSIFQFFIGKDFVSKYVSFIKLFSWIYWEIIDLKKYDLIISSSHSFMSKNVKRLGKARHISYIHTPPRYLYDEYNEINIIKNSYFRFFFLPFIYFLRYVDKKNLGNIDLILCNSKNVSLRIEKYYKKKSVVLYPAVSVPIKSDYKINQKNYYVFVSRLVKQKGGELIIRSFNKNNKKLLVIGDGDEMKYLKSIANNNIVFLGAVSDEKKFAYVKNAKALVYSSIEEDFGIVPVESLKMGVPVIAFSSGGIKEIICDKENGILFYEFNEKSLNLAIDKFEKFKFNRKNCKKSVAKYSYKNFYNYVNSIVN